MRPALSSSLLGFALLVLGAPSAFAQEAEPAPQLPPPAEATLIAPAPAPAATPTTNVQSAPGSGGLTVVAPLAGGGSITAVGCSSVTVAGHSTEVRPGAASQPCAVATPVEPEHRERYARDGGRKAAIITAPIVYGLGATIAGMTYLSNEHCGGSYSSSSRCSDRRNALWAYGLISAGVPSLPRWVVGDTVGALVYTGARGASIATAALVDWGHDGVMGPFLLGFAAPVALAIVDMATTPHRENLRRHSDDTHAEPAPEAKPAREDSARARITGITPVAMGDREHKSRGAGVALSGSF